jgi:ATP sulfurylase
MQENNNIKIDNDVQQNIEKVEKRIEILMIDFGTLTFCNQLKQIKASRLTPTNYLTALKKLNLGILKVKYLTKNFFCN